MRAYECDICGTLHKGPPPDQDNKYLVEVWIESDDTLGTHRRVEIEYKVRRQYGSDNAEICNRCRIKALEKLVQFLKGG